MPPSYDGKPNVVNGGGDDNKNGTMTVEGGSGGMMTKGNSQSLRNIPTSTTAPATFKVSNNKLC